MASLSGITVYIPTINRPKFLDRCLSFLASYGESLNILIFDSSTPENKADNEIICAKYSNLNISHIWEADTYIEFDNMGQMFYHVLENHIKTEFVVFSGDDDFLLVHNLIPHMNFLESHEDYIVCHGNIIMFENVDNKLIPSDIACSVDLPQDNPLERFSWHCYNGSSIQYGIIRTKDMLKAHRFCFKVKHKWLSSEVLPTILTVLYGKIKNSGAIAAFQEWGHPLISIKNTKENPLLNNWILKVMCTDESWVKSFTMMLSIFVKEAKKITGESEKLIYQVFENGFSYRILQTYDLYLRNWYGNNPDFDRETYMKHHVPNFSEIGSVRILELDLKILNKVLQWT